MRPARTLLDGALIVPLTLARSGSLFSRAGRGLLVLAVLCGQIGLPSVAAFATPSKDEHAASSTGSSCRCAPTLRKLGKCCCAKPSRPAEKSCCAKKTAKSPLATTCHKKRVEEKSPTRSKQVLVLRDACGCGSSADVEASRCGDPRVMPPRLVITQETVDRPAVVLTDASRCGELLPPPLPPPKAVLG